MNKRLHNIIKRMIYGDVFYASISPRMTKKEYYELEKMGFRIQCEWLHNECLAYYSMDNKSNKELLIKLQQTAQPLPVPSNIQGQRGG
jgi:hypothetical protein